MGKNFKFVFCLVVGLLLMASMALAQEDRKDCLSIPGGVEPPKIGEGSNLYF